jgi:hypothetical protein
MNLYPATPPVPRHYLAACRRERGNEGRLYPAAILFPIGGGGVGSRFQESTFSAYPATTPPLDRDKEEPEMTLFSRLQTRLIWITCGADWIVPPALLLLVWWLS